MATRYCYDWILLPAVLPSSREIYREITDSPETLSAHNMPRGLGSYIYCRTFEIGARRMEARTNSPWMSQKRTRQFPRGTSQPYPGLSSVALIYVLVSDVTRVRPLYSRRAAVVPLVCAQRILRHIIPGVAYINDRNWDLLCLSSAREILRADLLSLPSVASPFLSRLHLIVKYSRDPQRNFFCVKN